MRAYVSIRCACLLRQRKRVLMPSLLMRQLRQHTSAYVSIRQRTSAYVSVSQHTSAYTRALASALDAPAKKKKCRRTDWGVSTCASSSAICAPACQHLYFCTGKASKVSTCASSSAICACISALCLRTCASVCDRHTLACISIRESIREHTSAIGICQHT